MEEKFEKAIATVSFPDSKWFVLQRASRRRICTPKSLNNNSLISFSWLYSFNFFYSCLIKDHLQKPFGLKSNRNEIECLYFSLVNILERINNLKQIVKPPNFEH